MKSPTLSLVIPVFNEEGNLPALLLRLKELLSSIGEKSTEIIFVDDHSADKSPALLKAACRENPAFHYLRLSRNRGSHVAILAGLEHARGQCAVFLASDLQDPPELITQ